MNAPRFVTLTLKHRQETLRQSHDRLQQSFKKLRKEPVWKANVVGGCAVVEITRNPATKRWHTHLHLVIDGSFLPQASLSKAWKRCTGDSEIVDVRAVHDTSKVAKYIAEYVAKPQDLHTWESDAVLEFATHMHGRRMVATFGVCHAANVDPAEKAELSASMKYVGDVVQLAERAARGCRNARKACELLASLGATAQMAMGVTPGNVVEVDHVLSPEECSFIRYAFIAENFPDVDELSRVETETFTQTTLPFDNHHHGPPTPQESQPFPGL